MAIGATQKWYAGAAVASVGVLAAGWLLLITPQTSNAEQIQTQAAGVVAANQHAQVQVAALKAEFQNLPQLQSQLAAIRTRIPTTPDEPTLLRSVTAAAAKSGVTLASIGVTTPALLSSGTAGGATAATFTSPGAMSQLSLAISVHGTFADTRLFLNALESMQRVMLVTSVKITSTTSGTGETVLDTSITARVFTANPGGTMPASTTASTTGGSTAGTPS